MLLTFKVPSVAGCLLNKVPNNPRKWILGIRSHHREGQKKSKYQKGSCQSDLQVKVAYHKSCNMLNLMFRHEKATPESTFRNKQCESQVRPADFHLSLILDHQKMSCACSTVHVLLY